MGAGIQEPEVRIQNKIRTTYRVKLDKKIPFLFFAYYVRRIALSQFLDLGKQRCLAPLFPYLNF